MACGFISDFLLTKLLIKIFVVCYNAIHGDGCQKIPGRGQLH